MSDMVPPGEQPPTHLLPHPGQLDRGRDLDEVEGRHGAQRSAIAAVTNAIPLDWRRGQLERADLNRFVFGPEDVIVAIGQDGLVANVAKYLHGQPVIGINPDPDRNPGVLSATVPTAPAHSSRRRRVPKSAGECRPG